MFLECKKFIFKKHIKSKVFRDTFKLKWLFVDLDHKLIRALKHIIFCPQIKVKLVKNLSNKLYFLHIT